MWDAHAGVFGSCVDLCCWVVAAHCHVSSPLHILFLVSWESAKIFWVPDTGTLYQNRPLDWKLQFLEWLVVCLFGIFGLVQCLNVRKGENEATLSLPEAVRTKFSIDLWIELTLINVIIANWMTRLVKNLSYAISPSCSEQNPQPQSFLNIHANTLS